MLVNFFIHPKSIDNDINRSHVNALRSKWQEFGVLADTPLGGGFKDLRRRSLNLNQENRKLWNAALQEIENNPVRFLKCRDNPRVALISQTFAVNEKIPHGASKYVRDIEAIRLTEINDSKEFKRSENLSNKRIGVDEKTKDLWQERFQILARYAHEIVIAMNGQLKITQYKG